MSMSCVSLAAPCTSAAVPPTRMYSMPASCSIGKNLRRSTIIAEAFGQPYEARPRTFAPCPGRYHLAALYVWRRWLFAVAQEGGDVELVLARPGHLPQLVPGDVAHRPRGRRRCDLGRVATGRGSG